ncbi:N-acetylmuramoyl-L-alanine amidase family protein [Butyrivibrio sp. AE2032]|uniref:N-acetylmuramoyl-L-alanine amidase family protein n=1 Tax=Butyrivibrio sp. AE2032 TaxID=1458463 RepID=UPI00069098A0|nr:N-acetylmuramoyl-L-alanine amidase family protein [Butyrivibrio sp. AE2032]
MISNKIKIAGLLSLATAILLGTQVSAAQVPDPYAGIKIRSDFEYDKADELEYDELYHVQLSDKNNDVDLYRFVPRATGNYTIYISNMSADFLIGIIDYENFENTGEDIFWYCKTDESDPDNYDFVKGKTYYILAWTLKSDAAADFDLALIDYEGEGNPYAGWRRMDGYWCYMYENYNYAEGWTKIGGKWYFFNEDKEMQTGWIKDSGKWYYFTPSGVMTTGWQQISGKWYFFNGSGAMVTGWQQISGKWYFFNGSGAMVTGWQQISGKWYFFNGSGVMVTGWQQISGKWYYFNNSGAMATGWLKLSGKWYYLDPSSGAMVTGTKTIDGKAYNFDSNGVCQNP